MNRALTDNVCPFFTECLDNALLSELLHKAFLKYILRIPSISGLCHAARHLAEMQSHRDWRDFCSWRYSGMDSARL